MVGFIVGLIIIFYSLVFISLTLKSNVKTRCLKRHFWEPITDKDGKQTGLICGKCGYIPGGEE